ncbi:glycosyltransferase family 39 protein [Oculatella sp. LEGE 06141]|uniref:ArnT family glycosyltransferase n=1 Tax=Oculatella sp. LEGE 06141 TaxID=1828648 RepID=UPI0018815893|nr:glycosyltransferase family 39 protein [Oculatella sp. LEGE 06141]MBE9177365.1 glycosyltransferase family 39 protein [Oculatella sp. LEGE 06141]
MPAISFSSHSLSNRFLLTLVGLLLLCGVLFFWQLDGYTLFNITEAKQAEIARQIWVRQDWITPVYNGDIYFDKPILLHWLIAIGFRLFGLNEWAVRLPSAVSATGLVLITWGFVARFANSRIALLAATMLAANPFTFALGRTGQHDMLLTVFMTAALYCWYWAYSTGQRQGYLWFFACLGLAVLAKGPLALVLCSLAIAVFLTAVGRWREQFATVPWRWGLTLFGAITFPWYLLVLYANGWNFVDQSFVFNNVDRFVTANLNQVGPWWYYLPLLLVGFFPWVLPLLQTLVQAPRQGWLRLRYWRHQAPAQQIGLFMTIWLLTVLVFMSVAATKLPWYINPGFPALAYLCAQAWERQMATPGRWQQLTLKLTGLGYVLMAIAFLVLPRLLPNEPVLQSIQNTGALWILTLIHVGAAVAVFFSLLRAQAVWAWWGSLVAFSCVALTLVSLVLPVLDVQVLGGRLLPLAEVLQQETCEACADSLPSAFGVGDPSLNFYSRLSYIKRFEEPYELDMELQRSQRLLLVTKESTLEHFGVNLSCHQPDYVFDDIKLFIVSPDSDFSPNTCGLADGDR